MKNGTSLYKNTLSKMGRNYESNTLKMLQQKQMMKDKNKKKEESKQNYLEIKNNKTIPFQHKISKDIGIDDNIEMDKEINPNTSTIIDNSLVKSVETIQSIFQVQSDRTLVEKNDDKNKTLNFNITKKEQNNPVLLKNVLKVKKPLDTATVVIIVLLIIFILIGIGGIILVVSVL